LLKFGGKGIEFCGVDGRLKFGVRIFVPLLPLFFVIQYLTAMAMNKIFACKFLHKRDTGLDRKVTGWWVGSQPASRS